MSETSDAAAGRPILSAQGLIKTYGGRAVVKGVSLEVAGGEIVGLLGPNGAGKTTTFSIVVGLVRPDAGVVRLDDRDLTDLPMYRRAREGICYLPQEPSVFRKMTVEENLVVPMDALGRRNTFSDALYLPFSAYAERASRERARAILHVLELDRYARTLAADLPAGIQRRVEIARALAMRPRLLLLDEPAAGLDAQETARLAELLHAVRQRFHVSMLLVDHEEVIRLADGAGIAVVSME